MIRHGQPTIPPAPTFSYSADTENQSDNCDQIARQYDQMQRQRAKRIAVNHDFAGDAPWLAEYATNISRSGVFIVSDTPVAPGTTVDLRFTVVMDDMETIQGSGRVARVSDMPPGMGVEFVELTPQSRRSIELLVAALG